MFILSIPQEAFMWTCVYYQTIPGQERLFRLLKSSNKDFKMFEGERILQLRNPSRSGQVSQCMRMALILDMITFPIKRCFVMYPEQLRSSLS